MSPSPPAERPGGRPRIGYLGPEGTFSEEALLAGIAPGSAVPVGFETIYDAAIALREGEVDFSILPIENSLDGSVTVTLDLLAEQSGELEVLGEELLAVKHSLIAPKGLAIGGIERVLTHPQVPGQCRRFLRERLSGVHVVPASSTADAVRIAVQGGPEGRTAAIGTKLAAETYGGEVLQSDLQDRDDNLTRFVWLGRVDRAGGATGAASSPPLREDLARRPRKSSLVFWGPGADRAGWLVLCLDQFAQRQINLTKIESRPRRERMGHYMFFVDLEGDTSSEHVSDAIAGLRGLCEEVRVIGCYPAAAELEPAQRAR